MGRINGKSKAKENAGKFEKFIAERERLNDWNTYVHPNRRRLSRGKIVDTCGFTRSVLLQNPAVVRRLNRLEDELRERQILVGDGDRGRRGGLGGEEESDRDSWLSSLEEQLDVMEAAIREIREEIHNTDRRIDEIISC